MTHSPSRGFVGILSLLIASLLISLFYWTDMFSGVTGGTRTTIIEQNLHAIDAAKEVKKQMEQRTREEMEQLAN